MALRIGTNPFQNPTNPVPASPVTAGLLLAAPPVTKPLLSPSRNTFGSDYVFTVPPTRYITAHYTICRLNLVIGNSCRLRHYVVYLHSEIHQVLRSKNRFPVA